MAKLVVIIVSWNTRELTHNCLRSLFDDTCGMDIEVWVVDNNSSDDSVSMIKREFPQVKVIENKENAGFARANNQALRQANGEYYLLLNSDTVVPKGSIKALCEFMDSHPDAGAAAPNQRNDEGIIHSLPKRLPSITGELRECLLYHFFPINRILRSLLVRGSGNRKPEEGPARAEILSAACLIIRRNVIEKIGYLAEDYFLFSEENDYFNRMKRAGLTAYFLPHIEIIHLVGKSREKRGNIDSQVNFFRSRLKYFGKFYPNKIIVFKSIYFLFFGWSVMIASLLKGIRGRSEDEYYDTYRALIRVLRNRT
jgi:GT2 family glycosyltransferase